MNKIDLDTERRIYHGDEKVDNFVVNKLYGLDDLCSKYILNTFDILELGVNLAVSTRLFAYYANTVSCVDKFKCGNMNNIILEYPNIEFYHMTFEEFFKTNNKFFDLIYIDGFHKYEQVLTDLRLSLPFIKPKGYISGHDYSSKHPGVKQAIKDILNKEPEVFSDSSWIIGM